VAAGIAAEEAGELALTLVAAIEGGFMLSRAARSPEPMRSAGRLMQRLVAAALVSADVPG
jgi:Transcriptional regulator LmrA/YxaF-like, C-terminal domain